jgi:hypothetical protein
MTEAFGKKGTKLVRTVTETRVNEYELRFLREQEKRLATELADVRALIARAEGLKVEEAKEGVAPIEKLP